VKRSPVTQPARPFIREPCRFLPSAACVVVTCAHRVSLCLCARRAPSSRSAGRMRAECEYATCSQPSRAAAYRRNRPDSFLLASLPACQDGGLISGAVHDRNIFPPSWPGPFSFTLLCAEAPSTVLTVREAPRPAALRPDDAPCSAALPDLEREARPTGRVAVRGGHRLRIYVIGVLRSSGREDGIRPARAVDLFAPRPTSLGYLYMFPTQSSSGVGVTCLNNAL
jgi:hypothetical protein